MRPTTATCVQGRKHSIFPALTEFCDQKGGEIRLPADVCLGILLPSLAQRAISLGQGLSKSRGYEGRFQPEEMDPARA